LSTSTRVMAPSAKAANNGHHCPKAHGRDGNCRPWQGGGSKPQHCVAHQKVCPLHHEKHLTAQKPTRSKDQSPTDPNTIRATTTPDLQTWSDLFSSPLFLALALALSFVLVVTVIGLMSWTRRR
ncbi:unnamed protein product, partial [Aureobasidium pullulans]